MCWTRRTAVSGDGLELEFGVSTLRRYEACIPDSGSILTQPDHAGNGNRTNCGVSYSISIRAHANLASTACRMI